MVDGCKIVRLEDFVREKDNLERATLKSYIGGLGREDLAIQLPAYFHLEIIHRLLDKEKIPEIWREIPEEIGEDGTPIKGSPVWILTQRSGLKYLDEFLRVYFSRPGISYENKID